MMVHCAVFTGFSRERPEPVKYHDSYSAYTSQIKPLKSWKGGDVEAYVLWTYVQPLPCAVCDTYSSVLQ